MNLQAVLWDFGDTLADERWMLAPPDGTPGWPETYRQVLDGGELADRWNVGAATAVDVAEEFGRALGVPAGRILAHMRGCCRDVSLYPDVMALAARLQAPQAIVTINPDIFTEVVVPACDLTARFAAIVTSWEARTLSKADFCDIAMSRLPGAIDREACLLIDNRAENVAEWQARGGAAWHFQGCAGLADHLSAVLGHGRTRGDVRGEIGSEVGTPEGLPEGGAPMTSRPEFIAHWSELERPDDWTYAGDTELMAIDASLGRKLGLTRIGIHHVRVPPGRRTSYPHAESAEEEFVFVIEGRPDAWIDGVLHRLEPGDSVAFPAGTGICHTFLNNTDEEVRLLVVGEKRKPENRTHYPLHPGLEETIEFAWKDAPARPLGGHDGRGRRP